MAIRKASFQQANTHPAEDVRLSLLSGLLVTPGIVGTADLAVAPNGTPNMTVLVAAGGCWLKGSETTTQGFYGVYSDAQTTVTIAAADPTNPRIDLIVAKVQDASYSGAVNAASIVAVTGTPAASPVAPAAPASSTILAQVAVAALTTSIVAGNITDKRQRALCQNAGPIVDTAANVARQTGANGMSAWATDTYALTYYTTATTGNRPPWNMPWGIVGQQQYTTATNSGVSSVYADVGPSITFTAVANRIYKVTLQISRANKATGGGSAFTQIANAANTQIGLVSIVTVGTSGNDYVLGGTIYVTGTAAGSTTWKVRAYSTDANAISFQNGANPTYFMIEDVGPNGNPA